MMTGQQALSRPQNAVERFFMPLGEEIAKRNQAVVLAREYAELEFGYTKDLPLWHVKAGFTLDDAGGFWNQQAAKWSDYGPPTTEGLVVWIPFVLFAGMNADCQSAGVKAIADYCGLKQRTCFGSPSLLAGLHLARLHYYGGEPVLRNRWIRTGIEKAEGRMHMAVGCAINDGQIAVELFWDTFSMAGLGCFFACYIGPA